MRQIRAIIACMAALAVPVIDQSAAPPGKSEGVCKVTEANTSGSKADIVFTNGKIYTVNPGTPFAEAVAIKDGKFLHVGSAKDVEQFVAKRTHVVDLGGAFAMP